MGELDNLKVGDKVILSCWGWSYSNKSVATVEKITPTGLIKVKGQLYYKDGHVRGNGGSCIKKWTKEEGESIEKANLFYKMQRKCILEFSEKQYDLSLEQITSILKIMEEK